MNHKTTAATSAMALRSKFRLIQSIIRQVDALHDVASMIDERQTAAAGTARRHESGLHGCRHPLRALRLLLQASIFCYCDSARLLRDDERHRVGLFGDAERGAMARAGPAIERERLRQRQEAARGEHAIADRKSTRLN